MGSGLPGNELSRLLATKDHKELKEQASDLSYFCYVIFVILRG
jgi:hypothetical protein